MRVARDGPEAFSSGSLWRDYDRSARLKKAFPGGPRSGCQAAARYTNSQPMLTVVFNVSPGGTS